MSINIAKGLVNVLEGCKVKAAFGIAGGFIGPVWEALMESEKIKTFHCRHESGGVFAASEYSLCEQAPTVAFATAGPGISNALTGLKAARLDGAQVVFISSITSVAPSGKWGLQETTVQNINGLVLADGQGYFDEVIIISKKEDYAQIEKKLKEGFNKKEGYVVGIFLTAKVQREIIENENSEAFFLSNDDLDVNVKRHSQELADSIVNKKAVFWAGFGARNASALLTKIAIKTNSQVISTPRGKGIFDEKNSLYVGTSGLGADGENIYNALHCPSLSTVIIMGTRLGELSSSYAQNSLKDVNVYYIGLNAQEVKNNLPPHAVIIDCDIEKFLTLIDSHIDYESMPDRDIETVPTLHESDKYHSDPAKDMCHPLDVMRVIQEIAIDKFDCYVASEAGNSFVWANRYLKFSHPLRYRTSTAYGSMGHYACGMVGLAASKERCAVGIIGDGSMLMLNEVSTAVKYGLPAIWLVMNDASYNMCRQGEELLNNTSFDYDIPPVDFALFGQSIGATGYTVTNVKELYQALTQAIEEKKPAVINVVIDRHPLPPLKDRVESLKKLKV
ncbi:acetolactate synthase 2 catalytic subunit [Xenorhabdus mauleonii]|uniref:Acetolactate synthase 2 catalytic subunit n=1 Tax=Xenorhabdus mauleonii TaxID=351675 RepID=A0A1I3N5U9_9GAMM|nr:thiamine pyrophosphate-binding protein [Xenorhabdus mauleonii]PHM45783.1 acetolactate synthase 2 catalytic subunit [Xenorhabdus mauleonii]SFJ04196.1 acetolactate synthase-1/2/3 large subunit [Xenorhabdus mauleonii]